MAISTAQDRPLSDTPTWHVAAVVGAFVAASFTVMKAIDWVERWCTRRRKKALQETVHKMKEELMIVGFVSLLLSSFQNYVASICVRPTRVDMRFALCRNATFTNTTIIARSTLEHDASESAVFRRSLATAQAGSTCRAGYNSFVSVSALHQLHILIFLLAIMHIVNSTVTMLLAKLKVHSWKAWEMETQEKDANSLEQITQISRSLTLQRHSTFLDFHTSQRWTKNSILIWFLCFFRQFGQCVTKADYLGLRLGFITSHNTGLTFNFHSYIVRSMEDDFKTIVGISAALWVYVTLFLLFNIDRINLYLILSFAPPLLVLIVGCKLQHVISTIALEAAGVHRSYMRNVIPSPISPRDELFWFRRPGLLLSAIHFVLFQNAFEVAASIWFAWQVNVEFTSCIYSTTYLLYIRIVVGVCSIFLCSYSTLPLYSLVTHMGSNFKKSILSDAVKHKLHVWRKTAKRNAKLAARLQRKGGDDSATFGGNNNDQSSETTPENHRSSFSNNSSSNGSHTTDTFDTPSHHHHHHPNEEFDNRFEDEALKSMPLSPLPIDSHHTRSWSDSAPARSVTFQASLPQSDARGKKKVAKEKYRHPFGASEQSDDDTEMSTFKRSHFRAAGPAIHEEDDFVEQVPEESQLSFKFLPRGSISSAPI